MEYRRVFSISYDGFRDKLNWKGTNKCTIPKFWFFFRFHSILMHTLYSYLLVTFESIQKMSYIVFLINGEKNLMEPKLQNFAFYLEDIHNFYFSSSVDMLNWFIFLWIDFLKDFRQYSSIFYWCGFRVKLDCSKTGAVGSYFRLDVVVSCCASSGSVIPIIRSITL